LARKNRLKWACDFETTTDENDCHVWSWGAMEIGNPDNYVTGIGIDSFYEFMVSCNSDLYFHNLSFDNEFILPKLFKEKFTNDNLKTDERRKVKAKSFQLIKTTQNQLYSMDVTFGYKKTTKHHVNIIDSLKIIPLPIKVIAENFKLDFKKGDIDYNKHRPIGYEPTTEEWDYLYRDIRILADALHLFFSIGMKGNTISSMAMNDFKDILKEEGIDFRKIFPEVPLEVDDFFRKGYRGGFTWVNSKFQSKPLGEGKIYDVNSLYPSRMADEYLPYGTPVYFKGKYEPDQTHPLYVVKVNISFEIKPKHIPTIQQKKSHLHSKTNEYLLSSNGDIIELILTNVDLELIKKHYDIEFLEYIEGYKFKRITNIFTSYIEKWSKVKKEKKMIINGVLIEGEGVKYIAKLMLNSLYGKFASSVIKTKMLAKEEDGVTQYKKPFNEKDEVDEDYGTPIYTPMAMFITAYARSYTISTAQACYNRIIYCDTDSIHLVGLEVPKEIEHDIHPKDLGKWKHEYDFKMAKYLRPKTYIDYAYAEKKINKETGEIEIEECSRENHNTMSLVVKCAGMPDNIKKFVTFENFEVGFSSDQFPEKPGKLIPKRVKGGVVLIEVDFTIK
jgi:hypothetical protein